MKNKKIMVTIEGDINDGDDVVAITYVESDEDIELLRKVCKILSANSSRHNLEHIDEIFNDEVLQELWDNFCDIYSLPSGDEYLAHTINEIKIIEIVNEEKLF